MILPLAINRLYMLRPLEKSRLLLQLQNKDDFLCLSTQALSQMMGRKISTHNTDFSFLWHMAEQDEQWLGHMGIAVLQYSDSHYPPLLREIYDPPFLLMYRGNLSSGLARMPLAMVGTRHPDSRALAATREFAEECVEAQAVIISGLARGIDSAAHEGAIKNTWGVLGSGVDVVYPRQNQALVRNILEEGGCVFSEYPLGTAPRPHHFIARNRIISGMSQALVIMQAPARSGALITARYALEQGRDVYVHEAGMNMEGTQKLVEEGAICIRHAAELSQSAYQEQYTGGG